MIILSGYYMCIYIHRQSYSWSHFQPKESYLFGCLLLPLFYLSFEYFDFLQTDNILLFFHFLNNFSHITLRRLSACLTPTILSLYLTNSDFSFLILDLLAKSPTSQLLLHVENERIIFFFENDRIIFPFISKPSSNSLRLSSHIITSFVSLLYSHSLFLVPPLS